MPLLFDQISKTAELLTNRGVVQQVSTSLSPNKSLIYNKWLKCSVTFFQPLCITLLLFAFLSPPKGISNELLYISMRFDSTLYGREGGIVRFKKKKEQFRRSKDFVMEMKHFMQRPKQNIFCSRLMQILYVLVPKRLSAYGKGSIFFLFAINVILNFLKNSLHDSGLLFNPG